MRRPEWFDAECKHAECKQETRLCRSSAYWTSCACLQAIKKSVLKTTRRARHAYVKHQKAVFLDRLRKHSPEIHAMLRK